MEWKKNQYTITTDQKKMDLHYIHQYLSIQSYWSEGIPKEIVQKSMNGSLCFAVHENEKQIGFARVVTDTATFAYLGDVFIDENYRGKGLSKWLMKTIMEHPELQGFRVWILATKDAHGLYEQFGFKQLENPQIIMRKSDPDIYKKKTTDD